MTKQLQITRIIVSFVKHLDAHREACSDWHAVSINFLSLLRSQTAFKSMCCNLEEHHFVHCKERKTRAFL